jgi:hypothetical protein
MLKLLELINFYTTHKVINLTRNESVRVEEFDLFD